MTLKTGCFIAALVLLLVSAYLSSSVRDRLVLVALVLLSIALLG
jgi:hypothetical protein